MGISNNKLKEIALAAGPLRVGVTPAEPLNYMTERLEKRKKESRITPFEESNHHLRLSPGHLLRGSRSIITVAVPYAAPEVKEPKISGQPAGIVARCARGLDYHNLVEAHCRRVVENLKKECGQTFEYRILCDRSPLIERELARNSGLGIIGENCTLINLEYGSYTALGTILVTLELEPDQPNHEYCRQCGQCRQACPTGALIEPYIINPYLCLSYLTQAPGILPRPLRPKLGRHIYGCDICQDSCPHNSGVKKSPLPETAFAFFPAEPLLLPLLRMTQKEFRTTVSLTSAGWRGKTTLQRNAIIALGNIQDPASERALAVILENDSRTIIRAHAAWALGRIKTRKALFALEKSYQNDPESEVRKEAKLALENNRYPSFRPGQE